MGCFPQDPALSQAAGRIGIQEKPRDQCRLRGGCQTRFFRTGQRFMLEVTRKANPWAQARVRKYTAR